MSTHQLLLRPSDILFFRDGRPIEGALAGHGAAWPLPSVTDAAIHAALHRAFPVAADGLDGNRTRNFGDHLHRAVRKGAIQDDLRIRRFGSLVTAGPFPVDRKGSWHFPRPHDLEADTLAPTLLPSKRVDWLSGSLPDPLEFAVANTHPPSKESMGKTWLTGDSFRHYLKGSVERQEGVNDADFCDREHTVGIEIDPATQTTGLGDAAGKIYSAQYLRLRDGWRLGLLAAARNGEAALLDQMLSEHEGRPVIVVGGQQRVCTAEATRVERPQLPYGLQRGFPIVNGKHLVKWVLLTPAIWPEITPGPSRRGTTRRAHPGAWLPNWIDPDLGDVLLRVVSPEQRRHRRNLNYSGSGYRSDEGDAPPIGAKLVAALVGKPVVVTGWSLGETIAIDEDARKPGAKSAHLAVPAGSVYYFEADTADQAENLAAALNWHGPGTETEIKNRRSTLLGEKGFGLGVCGTWTFFEDVTGRPNN